MYVMCERWRNNLLSFLFASDHPTAQLDYDLPINLMLSSMTPTQINKYHLHTGIATIPLRRLSKEQKEQRLNVFKTIQEKTKSLLKSCMRDRFQNIGACIVVVHVFSALMLCLELNIPLGVALDSNWRGRRSSKEGTTKMLLSSPPVHQRLKDLKLCGDRPPCILFHVMTRDLFRGVNEGNLLLRSQMDRYDMYEYVRFCMNIRWIVTTYMAWKPRRHGRIYGVGRNF
jgi:hypothetical protein